MLLTLEGLRKGTSLFVHQGGTYSGKTFGILIALATYLYESERTQRWLIVGQSSTEMDDGVLKDWQTIMDYMPVGTCINKSKNIWKVNKCIVTFRHVDTVGKAKSGKRDGVFINECNHTPWDIAEQLMTKSDIKILDFNPTAKFWLHKKILPRLESYAPYLTTKTTYHDNPSVSEDKKREIELFKDDPMKYSAYVLGELGKMEGLVIPSYKTFSEFPRGQKNAYFLDFGFTNDVTALGEACIYAGEIFCKQLIYKTGLLTRDINDHMVKLGVNKNLPIYCDNIPKDVAELAAYGWKLYKTKKFPGSVNHGISILNQYKVNVHKESLDAIMEFDNYGYIKKDGEYINKPIDKHNHFVDGLRYWAMANCNARGKKTRITTGANFSI